MPKGRMEIMYDPLPNSISIKHGSNGFPFNQNDNDILKSNVINFAPLKFVYNFPAIQGCTQNCHAPALFLAHVNPLRD